MADKEQHDRPEEMPAVKTTIVGGRPPGCGKTVGNIPRGIEILIKKASVDPEFRELLLDQRSKAAETIDLVLEPAESKMLDAIPEAQLETIIKATKVPKETGRKLRMLGKVAGLTLAALGAAAGDCDCGHDRTIFTGVQADLPPAASRVADSSEKDTEDVAPSSQPSSEQRSGLAIEIPQGFRNISLGHLADRPVKFHQSRGISPDRPETRPADEEDESDLSEGQEKD